MTDERIVADKEDGETNSATKAPSMVTKSYECEQNIDLMTSSILPQENNWQNWSYENETTTQLISQGPIDGELLMQADGNDVSLISNKSLSKHDPYPCAINHFDLEGKCRSVRIFRDSINIEMNILAQFQSSNICELRSYLNFHILRLSRGPNSLSNAMEFRE